MATLPVGDGKTYTTIDAAFVAARSGTVNDFDIIEIYDNKIYDETISTSSIDWVLVRNAEGSNPVMNSLDTKSAAFSKENTEGIWTVQGITILNYDNGGTDSIFQGSFPNGSAVSVQDCLVIGANRFFGRISGISADEPAIIERNFLSGATSFVNAGNNAILRNNIIKQMTSSAPTMTLVAGRTQMTNNLIIDMPSGSAGLVGYTSDNNQGTVEYANNIIVNTRSDYNNTIGVNANWPYSRHNFVIGGFDNQTPDGAHTGSMSASYDDIGDTFLDFPAFLASSITSIPTMHTAVKNLELMTSSIAVNGGSSGSINGVTDDFFERSRTIDYDGNIYTTSSLYFADVTNYAHMPFEEFDDEDQFTVSCWIKPFGVDGATNTGNVWLVGEDDARETTISLRGDNSKGNYLSFVHHFDTGSSFGKWNTATNIITSRHSAGQWYHVVATYDKSSASNVPKIYLDNVELALSESQGPSGVSAPKLYLTATIGAGDTGTHNYVGNMRDWSYWTKELDVTEINELWNGGTPIPMDSRPHSADEDLFLYIPFDDLPEGNNIIAEEQTGRAITLVGSPHLTASAPQPNFDVGPMRFIWAAAAVPPPPRDPRARVSTSKRFRGGVRFVRVYQSIRRE